jgi:hypothetical protein
MKKEQFFNNWITPLAQQLKALSSNPSSAKIK